MIAEKVILWNTNYGKVASSLKEVMKKKNISISQICRLTGIKYEIIKNYYSNNIVRYDAETLAKLCYVLDCAVSDLITYIPNHKPL